MKEKLEALKSHPDIQYIIELAKLDKRDLKTKEDVLSFAKELALDVYRVVEILDSVNV